MISVATTPASTYKLRFLLLFMGRVPSSGA
jgi:hypothetical protein